MVQVAVGACLFDVAEELVGDLRERYLGDVELVLCYEPQQQVERAFEVGQVHGEAAGVPLDTRRLERLGRRCRAQVDGVGHRASTSRASWR
jgi:hypothetical protein